jgi:hypothetical protein
MIAVVGTVALLAQRSIDNPLSPTKVATLSDVSRTPLPLQVEMRHGADRVLQRERTRFFTCVTQAMGCPASVQLESVTVLLVRDDADALRAFIAEDPRNGCALEWLPAQSLFHDVCHGSIYNTRGERVGGPSPWNLNELATSLRGNVIWIDPSNIIVGACPGCPAQ